MLVIDPTSVFINLPTKFAMLPTACAIHLISHHGSSAETASRLACVQVSGYAY